MRIEEEMRLYLEEANKKHEELMRSKYSDLYLQGYKFFLNKISKDAKLYVNSLEAKGHEVLIGEMAFDMSLKCISPEITSIFIREKKL